VNKLNTDPIDLSPFEAFVREKIAYLLDESKKRNEKITRIINDFASLRVEMLQSLK
jgi:hypothetical protein